MALISEEEINNIRTSANIVDIIADYIPLTKSGSDYVGVCPFHDDHSPSMRVSTRLNIFKCFVCNTGGNVFSFVQKFENVSYIEAIKIVAQKSGIDLKIDNNYFQNKKYNEEYALMDLSLKYYQNNLASQEGMQAKKYLLNRHIDDNIINEFKIGLSLDNNSLKKFLENKKSNLEMAYSVGLLNKSNLDYYDTFINRIMIPIFDINGSLAGYTARCYLQDDKSKYINSKESVIYKKSNILFNFHNAKENARLNHEIIIVEGNMDAISLASAGIKNVIALMGVVISKAQIEAIKRLNSRVVLILDSDNAGDVATLNVGNELYSAGLDVYIVRLSGAKDPDEYLRKYNKEDLLLNIKHAKKYLDYKLDTLKKEHNLDDVAELTSYIKKAILSIDKATDLEKEVAIAKLCKDHNLDPKVIKKYLTSPKTENAVAVKVQHKKSYYEKASEKLLYAMLLNKDYYWIYLNKLGFFEEKIQRDLAAMIASYIKKHGDIDPSGLLDYVHKYEDIYNYLNKIISENHEENIQESDFYDILYAAKRAIEANEIAKVKKQIKNENDIAKKIVLIEHLRELKKGCGNNEGN